MYFHLQRYDFGVSQHYQMESHGGTTFCAIATLQLSDQLNLMSSSVKDKMIRWLLFRQVSQSAVNTPFQEMMKINLYVSFRREDLMGARTNRPIHVTRFGLAQH